MILLLWFGACAALLAAIGIYSVIAETIAVRKHEIAIRTALGARRTRLVRGIMSKTLGFVLTGEVVGVCAVVLGYNRISGMLYGVASYGPIVLGSVVVFVFSVSLCAGCWPAWSAVDCHSIDLR
jgi:ABC-type antimicrobial peptide transport system permease subunit